MGDWMWFDTLDISSVLIIMYNIEETQQKGSNDSGEAIDESLT